MIHDNFSLQSFQTAIKYLTVHVAEGFYEMMALDGCFIIPKKFIVFTACTSLHKHGQKNITKTIAEIRDPVLIHCG